MKKLSIELMIILLCSGCALFPKDKCMGDYTGKIANENVSLEGDFAICANRDKEPIFKDSDKALKKIESEYADTLEVIQETFSLKDFNENTLENYHKYSSQLTATSEQNKKNAANLTTLLEIYQNGQEK